MNKIKYTKHQDIEGNFYYLVIVLDSKNDVLFSDKTLTLDILESASKVFNATLPEMAAV